MQELNKYACPAWAYFSMKKSRQKSLGAVPQDPLTLKLRLDTNDVDIVRTAPQIRSQGACGAFYVEIVDGEGSRGLGRGPPIGRGSSFADYKVFA